MHRIAELRKGKGLTQAGLGLKLNVSQKMISSYENGTHQPGIDTLIEMTKLFNVSSDYIIGISDIKMSAERFSSDNLDDLDIELIDMFKELDYNKKQKALGILYALTHIDK